MSDISADVAENIMKFCIIPYAEQQNISTDVIIQKLCEYHKLNNTNKNEKKILKRGRPKGSKNKDKTENTTPRKRGRPAGSNKKSSDVLHFDD